MGVRSETEDKVVGVIPPFDSQPALDGFLSRCAWYFSPYLHGISCLDLATIGAVTTDVALPENLDPAIQDLLSPLLEKVRFRDAGEDLGKADILICWRRLDPQEEASYRHRIVESKSRGAYYDLDAERSRMEGSHFLWAGLNHIADKASLVEECRQKLLDHAGRFTGEKAYLFGTGPSLSSAYDHDFSDGSCIIANSMVRNRALLDHLEPIAVAAGDPIFHAGCSRYAAEFRRSLREVMVERNLLLFVPLRDYPVYINVLPASVHERIIGIPFDSGRPFNASLLDDYYVNPLPNILTLILLPLAATFFRDIRIVGCDGRPLEEDGYFWSHDKASQFNDSMQNIREVHPAFFAIDYNDYYQDHCRALSEITSQLEGLGKQVSSLTPSYIPALRDRFEDSRMTGGGVAEVISIDPDGVDYHGHFLSYDCRLAEAVRRKGKAFSLLANCALDEEADLGFRDVERVLSVNSWTIGNRPNGPDPKQVEKFKSEIERSLRLRRARGLRRRAVVYMYCGSLPHARAVLEAMEAFPEYSANINLFWTSFVAYRDRDYVALWRDFLGEAAVSDRIRLTVPTKGLQQGLRDAFGVELDVAPHPSTTFSDEHAVSLAAIGGGAAKPETGGQSLRVLYPGGVGPEKGFDLVPNILREVSERGGTAVRQIVRLVERPAMPPAVRRIIEEIRGLQVEIVDRDMDDDEFGQFLAECDVVVLPYRSMGFSERTSGLLIDALILAKPVVVFGGTWLGDMVAKYGFGCIAAEENAEAMADAIASLHADIEPFRKAAENARGEYIRSDSWDTLADSIAEPRKRRNEVSIATSSRESHMSFVSYPREVQAHIDETRLISLLTGAGEGKTRVMIDVGAHFGGSAAHFVDKGWTIHCFEPDPANRAKLVARLGRRANVTIDPRAVGERPETGKAFFTSGQSTGISGLSAFHDTHTQSGEVDVTTVAEIVEKAGLAGVDFLKIDVEGFDFAVLKGVPWAHFKPAVIECEFEDAKTVPLGHSWRDIAEFLTALGYKVYVSEWHPVIRYGIRHDWLGLKRYPCDLDRAEAWGNLLAFLEDPGEEAIAAALKACVSVKAPAPRETGKKEAKAREPAKEVAKMPEPAKSAPPPAMTPRPASPPPSLFARLRRRAGLAYMAFAASVKARSLTLYRVGQFAVWSLRLARRKIRASLFGAAMLAGLIALPLVFSPLAPFAVWFWAAAALLGLAGGGLLAVAFANMMVRRFAEHELHARQMLKADLHRQLAKRDRETEKARADLADAQARLGHLEKGAGESGARFGLLEKSADETGNALAAARAGFDKALAEVRREMQAMAQDALAGNAAAQEEIAVLTRENRARLDRLEERLSRDLDALRAQSGTLADNFAEATEGVRESFIAEISRAHYRLAEDLKGLHTSQEDLAKLIEQTRLRGVSLEQRLAADFDGVREEAEAMSRRFGEMVAGIREELGRDLSTAREEIGGEVTGMRAAHDELGGRVEAAQARIGQIERLAPVFNFSGFQSFNRKLTGEHIKVIEEQWASRLGTNMTPRKLSYLAHRIATLESNLHGRLATSVENAVLRTLIAASAKGDTLHVLEIGTLFGVGLAMIHDHARPRFQSVHLTAIDPLEGYYDKGPEDLTGQIVDEATFRRNLADAGVPESDYTLIRALSTDEAAVEAASRSRYDVLIIDGDHSYAGVKADFLLYLPFVKRGGYIIFDDYDVQDWPDVKRFVDEFVQSHPDVAHVGSNWRTAVFRVVRPAAQREDVPRGEGKVALLRQPG